MRLLLGLAGLAVVSFLFSRSGRFITMARALPAPDRDAQAANRRVSKLFWINFAVEIALINLAVGLMAHPALSFYVVPVISFIVGLHFLPMASFLAVPTYWAGGATMIVLAATVCLALSSSAVPAPLLVSAEAICNAIILWSMAAWGLYTTGKSYRRSEC